MVAMLHRWFEGGVARAALRIVASARRGGLGALRTTKAPGDRFAVGSVTKADAGAPTMLLDVGWSAMCPW